jgi:hypothetical protein
VDTDELIKDEHGDPKQARSFLDVHALANDAEFRAFIRDFINNDTILAAIQDGWISPAYDAVNFTANGTMTWTVDAGDVITYAYKIVGRTMTIQFVLAGTSVGGALNTDLRVAIPAGKIAAKTMTTGMGVVSDNAVESAGGRLFVTASAAFLTLQKLNAANWTASVNNTAASGQIAIEIQ